MCDTSAVSGAQMKAKSTEHYSSEFPVKPNPSLRFASTYKKPTKRVLISNLHLFNVLKFSECCKCYSEPSESLFLWGQDHRHPRRSRGVLFLLTAAENLKSEPWLSYFCLVLHLNWDFFVWGTLAACPVPEDGQSHPRETEQESLEGLCKATTTNQTT